MRAGRDDRALPCLGGVVALEGHPDHVVPGADVEEDLGRRGEQGHDPHGPIVPNAVSPSTGTVLDVTVSSYLTVGRDGGAEIEVEKSRFRCTIARVPDEVGARGLVDQVRKQHWNARHHCNAFIVGPDRARRAGQ